MTTVGYGDITPLNPVEIIFAMTAMFLSCIIFAYSVNSIWDIINEYRERDVKYE